MNPPGSPFDRVAAPITEAAGRVFAEDSDPELVREAIPFALKTTEALLAESPEHDGLLLTACKGFTQYAYAFVETDAELIENTDYRRATELSERALNLYLRARDAKLSAWAWDRLHTRTRRSRRTVAIAAR